MITDYVWEEYARPWEEFKTIIERRKGELAKVAEELVHNTLSISEYVKANLVARAFELMGRPTFGSGEKNPYQNLLLIGVGSYSHTYGMHGVTYEFGNLKRAFSRLDKEPVTRPVVVLIKPADAGRAHYQKVVRISLPGDLNPWEQVVIAHEEGRPGEFKAIMTILKPPGTKESRELLLDIVQQKALHLPA